MVKLWLKNHISSLNDVTMYSHMFFYLIINAHYGEAILKCNIVLCAKNLTQLYSKILLFSKKFRKWFYVFTCILPDYYVPHESQK